LINFTAQVVGIDFLRKLLIKAQQPDEFLKVHFTVFAFHTNSTLEKSEEAGVLMRG